MIYNREILTRGGRGGDGCVSFRREKYIPFGGPDGGDGGNGGSVIVRADRDAVDLGLRRRGKEFAAGEGDRGSGRRRQGKNGEDLVIPVPVGTMVYGKSDSGLCSLLADLDSPGKQVQVARGGRGGLGNTRFATAVNQAPEIATEGRPGEERHIVLELKLITDICIVGSPNSGKSTLLAAVTKARPEIAAYPFTTREPVLGVMSGDKRDFVVAEIPGLVMGAHQGKGLGNAFLRHVERTRLLILLLDGSSDTAVADLRGIDEEIALYKRELAAKPRIVAVNKGDLPDVGTGLSGLKQEWGRLGVPVFCISALTGRGVLELAAKAMQMVDEISEAEADISQAQPAVFRPKPRK